MYIIALKGTPNSGKTSSIKFLILQMLKLSDIKVIYSSKFSKRKAEVVQFSKAILNPWDGKSAGLDISVLLEYKRKRIYITSNGDCIKDILRNLDNVTRRYGDIVICVCGRHKCNVEKIEFSVYSPKVLEPVFKEKTIGGDFDKENEKTGLELFKRVKKCLEEMLQND